MSFKINPPYEDIVDELGQDIDSRYKDFLLEKPRTLVLDNLIFDLERLDAYYHCPGCQRRRPQAFCCARHDLELTRRDIRAIEKVLPDLVRSDPRLDRLVRPGFWKYGAEFEKVMRRKQNGDCLFLLPGARGCALHRHALAAGLDPLELKPYICSLFPLVAIYIDDAIVVTTLNPDSEKVLDCGGKVHFCTAARGKNSDHALRAGREILTRMFGKKVVRKVLARVF